MKIIANPRAGHGQGEKNIARLERVIRRRGLDLTPILTHHPGHATDIARDLADSGEPRVAIMGGDGSIREVVDALVGTPTELAIVPMGTGNDIARSLGLPLNDPGAAIEIALNGRARTIDVGREGERHFLSVLGVGFPAIVAEEANRATWLKGSASFFVAVYKALHRLQPHRFVITLDDETLELDSVAVMVQNTPYTGGGLLMAPDALIDDGLFDVVIVDDIGKLDLMVNFPKAYRGRHLEHPSFSLHRSSTVQVSSEVPMRKMLDGDICGSGSVEVAIVPEGLKIVAGSGAEEAFT